MTTVYWGQCFESTELFDSLSLLLAEPEPVLPQIIRDREVIAGSFTSCPAFQDYYRNTYVVRSPVDITLTYDAKADFLYIKPQDQNFFDNFLIHRGTQIGKDDKPLFSFNIRYLFIADKDCLIEQIPVSMHDVNHNQSARLIGGTFNIAKWYRPIEFAFELLTDEFKIKKGDPLFYVRFVPKDSKKISLVYKEYTDEDILIAKKCTYLKKAQQNLGLEALYKLAERLHHKLWFNKKKCPFTWRNK